jgi:cytochrome c oxidase subunit 3
MTTPSYSHPPDSPAALAQPGSQSQATITGSAAAYAPPLRDQDHGHTFLAHQFDDLEQQKDASTLGMWAFLATEVMFFGGLFTAFTVYRISYPETFAKASTYMARWLGAFNTGVLLCSSYTVVLAVAAAQENRRRDIVKWLLLTIVLAAAFLCFKGYEYYHEYKEHLVPFANWSDIDHDGTPRFPTHPHAAKIYFLLYFIMTGIHATHMVIGIGIFAVIALQAARGRYSAEYYNPVEISGLYWHFVDAVWIFLFPLLYLLH